MSRIRIEDVSACVANHTLNLDLPLNPLPNRNPALTLSLRPLDALSGSERRRSA